MDRVLQARCGLLITLLVAASVASHASSDTSKVFFSESTVSGEFYDQYSKYMLNVFALQQSGSWQSHDSDPVQLELHDRNIPMPMAKNGFFRWSDCSLPGSPVQVKTLELTPDPVLVPGTASVDLAISSSEQVAGPISLDVQLFKHTGSTWNKAPCINQLGSCSYPDICSVLKEKVPNCPGNTTCHCPFPPGSPHLQHAFTIPTPGGIPLQLIEGQYHIIANATGAGPTKFNFCIDLYLALHIDL